MCVVCGNLTCNCPSILQTFWTRKDESTRNNDISVRAYLLWEKAGKPEGAGISEKFWKMAEDEAEIFHFTKEHFILFKKLYGTLENA